MMMLGIVSYLPNNEERAEHLKLLIKNIESYERIKNSLYQIYVVCQNFTREEIDSLPSFVNKIYFKNGLGPAGARNVLLQQAEILYDAKKIHHLLLCDHDTWINPNNDLIIKLFSENPEFLDGGDIFAPVWGRLEPLMIHDLKQGEITFKPYYYAMQCMIFNIKSIYGSRYDVDALEKNVAEDDDFILGLVTSGKKMYQVRPWVHQTSFVLKPTWSNLERKNMGDIYNRNRINVNKKYFPEGVGCTKNNLYKYYAIESKGKPSILVSDADFKPIGYVYKPRSKANEPIGGLLSDIME